MANKLDLSPKSNWYKEPENLSDFHENWLKMKEKIPYPVITRYLNQRQLHQLVSDLSASQKDGSIIHISSPNSSFMILKGPEGWTLWDPTQVGKSEDCKTLACLDKILDLISIYIIGHFSTYGFVQIYHFLFPFQRSLEEKGALEKYLPKEVFDYPPDKIFEKDYLSQLKEENVKLKETLTNFFPRGIPEIIEEYYTSPEQIETRKFLETSLLMLCQSVTISVYRVSDEIKFPSSFGSHLSFTCTALVHVIYNL